MTASALTIGYLGEFGYAVFDGKTQISGRFGNKQLALTRLENIQRDRAKTKRPCLCCNTMMESTGPGHRLCDPCRDHVGRLGWVA